MQRMLTRDRVGGGDTAVTAGELVRIAAANTEVQATRDVQTRVSSESMSVGGRVVWIRASDAPRQELAATLKAYAAETLEIRVDALSSMMERIDDDTLIVELEQDQAPYLRDLMTRVSARTRVIGIGDVRVTGLEPDELPLDCLLFGDADEEMLQAALQGGPPLDLDTMLSELLPLALAGGDLAQALTDLVTVVARAFEVDDCLLMMAQEATCYSSQELTPKVLHALMPLCESVCQLATPVLAPPRPDRPYRAFLGVPIAQDNAPPVAHLVLCRTTPLPFDRQARRHLASLTKRLSRELPWHLAQERMLADRDNLGDVPRVDPVLGVANRTALDEELPQLVARSERVREPFTVAIIDVDGLRLINERHGYRAGDAVLAHVAQHAARNTRPIDLVARYAGDAIAIVLPGVDAKSARTTLTQILSEIDVEPVTHERKAINLTVSAGICELQYDHDTGEIALARAMAARRNARRHGEVIATGGRALIADPPVPADFAIGTTLGGVYQVRHEVSRGAYGVVYRAEDMALNRQVALKLLRTDLAADEQFVERFRSEAATLARIRNTNLVQVYAFGVDGENVFFAMELVEGQSLQERVDSAYKRMRHMPLAEVTGTIDQVANALDALHQAGMLHRDVKPENVLIDRIHRRCVLIDVGIAVRVGSDKLPAGTPGHTAPEVFGAHGESAATDVYSLGVLAYVLLTLTQPFTGWTAIDVLTNQLEPPQPPTAIRRDLPAGIDDLILSALDPDPDKRPQSARAFAKSLAEVLAPATSDARHRPRATMEPPIRRITNVVSSRAGSQPLRISSSRPPALRTPATPEQVRRSSRHPVPDEPSTRGVLFRSIYEVLGARRGSALIAEFKRSAPHLSLALGSQNAPLAWQPTSLFVSVLESLSQDVAEQKALAMQVGRAAAAASFAQFYGAETKAMTPVQTLGAADNVWRNYHSWGSVWVKAGASEAEVVLMNAIPHPLLCATTGGLLAEMVAQGHPYGVDVKHTACAAEQARRCVYKLTWTQAPAAVT
jgi:diguanylate cyclase (GGDEF)-like protein